VCVCRCACLQNMVVRFDPAFDKSLIWPCFVNLFDSFRTTQLCFPSFSILLDVALAVLLLNASSLRAPNKVRMNKNNKIDKGLKQRGRKDTKTQRLKGREKEKKKQKERKRERKKEREKERKKEMKKDEKE